MNPCTTVDECIARIEEMRVAANTARLSAESAGATNRAVRMHAYVTALGEAINAIQGKPHSLSAVATGVTFAGATQRNRANQERRAGDWHPQPKKVDQPPLFGGEGETPF